MTEPADILIIGSGASGGAFAWSMAGTRMRIVCLEQGDWVKPQDYPSTGRDWEARRYGDSDILPNRRQAPADYPVNDANSITKIANYNAVGGGTVHYAAHFPRLHPSDFRVKSLDGVAEDWPIGYRTLEPFFTENDRMMGISGMANDPSYPDHEYPMPPVPLGRSGTRFAETLNKLGWHWWPSAAAIATTEYEGRAPCINLGHCLPGCAQGAKASTDITYWPAAIRAGVELRTNCRVREITVGPDGMATGAIYYDRDGREVFQPAHVVVMAANGVGTPRLLLNSKSERFPNGLANSSDLVGRNLMLHPWPVVVGWFNEEMDGQRGPIVSIWSKQFYETDTSRGFTRGYMMQFGRGPGPVGEAQAGLESGRMPWGAGHHAAMRTYFHRRAHVGIACDDLPEPHNRVTLDPVLKDSHGIPAPRIDYTVSANTAAMMEHGIARGTELLQAAGAHTTAVSRTVLNYPGHLLGTCRMGTNPATSVVNEWGRSHDVRNLFVIDGSVFVTGGGVNPTSTIQAIALYIADQMKQRLDTLFD